MTGLRWRTEDEVVSGVGETTCGNPRCKHHEPDARTAKTSSSNRRWDDDSEVGESSRSKKRKEKKLVTLELPFSYEEHEEQKTALVKVVLCERCVKKLNWKREKGKGKERVRGDDLVDETTPGRAKENSTRRSRSRSPNRQDSGDPVRSKGLNRDGEASHQSHSRRGHTG
jgi:protein FRA10AC1